MTDKPAESAVERWEEFKRDRIGSESPILASLTATAADAAIAELKARIEELSESIELERAIADAAVEARQHETKRADEAEADINGCNGALVETEAKLAAAEERVRELEARWTEAWCPNCHAVIEQCPYCGYDTAPDCFVRDRARLTAPEPKED